MTSLNDDSEDSVRADLERRIGGLLRGLPDRSAPSSLEGRVLAAIGRRTRLPWWRQSYGGWPPAMKGALLAGCGAVALAGAYGLDRVAASVGMGRIAATALSRLGGNSLASALAADAIDTVRALSSAVSPLWITALLALFCSSAALVAAAGIALRRALPAAHFHSRA